MPGKVGKFGKTDINKAVLSALGENELKAGGRLFVRMFDRLGRRWGTVKKVEARLSAGNARTATATIVLLGKDNEQLGSATFPCARVIESDNTIALFKWPGL